MTGNIEPDSVEETGSLEIRRNEFVICSTTILGIIRQETKSLNSSSVSNGFMFAAVVKRKNKP